MYQQHMLLKLRKHILKYTLNCSIMSIGFASFKHLNLPISTKIANCLYLHGSFFTKFDFMNYAFAKLLLAQLYYNV